MPIKSIALYLPPRFHCSPMPYAPLPFLPSAVVGRLPPRAPLLTRQNVIKWCPGVFSEDQYLKNMIGHYNFLTRGRGPRLAWSLQGNTTRLPAAIHLYSKFGIFIARFHGQFDSLAPYSIHHFEDKTIPNRSRPRKRGHHQLRFLLRGSEAGHHWFPPWLLGKEMAASWLRSSEEEASPRLFIIHRRCAIINTETTLSGVHGGTIGSGSCIHRWSPVAKQHIVTFCRTS